MKQSDSTESQELWPILMVIDDSMPRNEAWLLSPFMQDVKHARDAGVVSDSFFREMLDADVKRRHSGRIINIGE